MATFAIQRSELFMQQWRSYAQDYHDRAGIIIAERFIVEVERALHFIHHHPYACSLYDAGDGYDDLRKHPFRKWNLNDFPHMVLFRIGDNATIFVEVIYAHKMDVPSRLAAAIDESSGR
ncbi:MAG TPA: type II toxin-antitoxin system RelE/ParE family toxin [Gemmataceae bacterium]|jgi:hypothetical protein|nr:type II toxin-antitoxin system RelE/ParE family toxin [Gemmataceae bacterium]